MSRELLNTLFVMTQGSYVHLEGETAKVEAEGKTILQVPLHHIGSVVMFGNVMVSPQLMHKCASEGRNLSFLDMGGRFRARVVGAVSGNVLLREAQYRAYVDDEARLEVVKSIVAGKLQNMRSALLRAGRECRKDEHKDQMCRCAEWIAEHLKDVENACDIDQARGYEGQASADYFMVMDHMIVAQRESFKFSGRNRRPPRDRVNALLSFLYAVLLNDCIGALEGVGLDPEFGFLHALRSGKPALALDMMEEFRVVMADRLAMNLINRQQIKPEHFDERAGGAVMLNDDGRKAVLTAYQKRKQAEVQHHLLKSKTPLGLVPHLQARILARRLRGDIPRYVPYYPR